MNIEELAFKDRKNLAQLTELDLLDIIEFLQFDRKQWINQFSKTYNESIDIQQENKQLKESYSKLEGKYFANVPCCNENDCDLYRDYMKLKDNWNKLKEIAKSQSGFKKRADLKGGLWFEIDDLLDKMQELEQGSDSNE